MLSGTLYQEYYQDTFRNIIGTLFNYVRSRGEGGVGNADKCIKGEGEGQAFVYVHFTQASKLSKGLKNVQL